MTTLASDGDPIPYCIAGTHCFASSCYVRSPWNLCRLQAFGNEEPQCSKVVFFRFCHDFCNPVKQFTCISRCWNALTCFDVPTRTISYMRASFTQDGGLGHFQNNHGVKNSWTSLHSGYASDLSTLNRG